MKTDLVDRRCGYCKGAKRIRKSEYGLSAASCPICKAKGVVNIPEDYTVCGTCDGTGRTASGFANYKTSLCRVCDGKGWAKPD